jgi:hypothetical protein
VELQFSEWLCLVEGSRRPGTKSGLYPLGYDGIGNYPPADILTYSADAITYLDMDDRIFKTHEGKPFSIEHIPGKVVEPSDHDLPGKEVPFGKAVKPPRIAYKLPPGDVVRPTSWVKLVTNPQLLDPKKFKNAP